MRTSRVFRVFVSSTFDDLREERDALQRDVFPRLARLCARHGCQFQAIDLRWGVSEEATLDQQTMNICLTELDLCREVTPRPNFLILLGDRYGWIPLPPQVEATEFEAVRSACLAGELLAAELIDEWYRRDENAVPPVYRLRARRVDVPQEANLGPWRETEGALRAALLRGVERLGWLADDPCRVKYQCSATHQEILRGALGAPDTKQGVFAFFRNIVNRSGLGPQSSLVDTGSGQIDALKASLSKSPGVRAVVYSVSSDDLTANLGRLRVDALRSVARVIREEIRRLEMIDPLDRENQEHAEFGEKHSRCFGGRTGALQAVADYVRGDAPNPLVLYGPSGSGKTALLARAAADAAKGHPRALVIRRFIGATPESTDVRLLLDNVRQEVLRVYGGPPELFDEDWDVKSALRACLASAAAERPLILFVDALDQLGAAVCPSALDWLPRDLPRYARVVVSVLESEGESGGALRSIADRLPPRALLRLEEMPPDEAESILDGWLAESGRTLTTDQRGVVMGGFRGCPNPLYLRLAFEEARKWTSADAPEALAADAQSMVIRLVERWRDERQHGRALVDAFLGLLASSRYGLSEVEVLDLLSSDEAAMRALSEHSVRPFPSAQLPTAVWVRLYNDVAPYLVSRSADSGPLMSFYHRLVAEVIAATGQQRERHGHLARYFRKAADPRGDGSWTGAATHALQELPFQLAQIDPQAHLELLTDFAWLQAKVDRGLYGEAIADAKLGADQSRDGRSVRMFRLLSRTLQLARAAERDHGQLAGQIVGRLFGRTEPELARLLDGARAWRGGYWLCPEGPALRSPSAAVEETLMGSGQSGDILVAALEDPDRFVTAAGDGLLAIWSLREGREIEVLEAHSAPISLLCASPSGRHLLSVSGDGRIRLWKARKTGLEPAADWTERLERVKKGTLPDLPDDRGGYSWVAACFSADDSSFALAGVDHVIRVRKIDDLARVMSLGADRDDHSAITSISASADGRLLASGSNDKTITIYDVAQGTIHARLAGHREVVQSVCLSADGAKLLSTCDGTARVWRVDSRDHAVLSEDLGAVRLGVWTPDGGSYVFADSLNRVLVLCAPDGPVRASFEVPGFPITSATLSTDGAFVITCAFDQQVTITRLSTSGTAAGLNLSENLATAIAIAPDAGVAAVVVSSSMGLDQQMRLFHLPAARERFSTTAWTPGKGAMALLDEGRRIASVQEYGRTITELSGGFKRWHWSRDHSIYTLCSASSMSGRWLAYVRSDGKVGLWDSRQENVEEVDADAFRRQAQGVSRDVLEDAQELQRFMRATRSVGLAVNDSGNSVASAHPDPELAASVGQDAEVPADVVTVWRRSGRLMAGPPKWKSKAFRLEGYEISRIALSDDGKSVLTCLSSGEIGLLDCRKNTFTIAGWHFGEAVYAFLGSDPLRGLTASADRMVKVWDGVTCKLLAEFQADWPIVACAASSAFSQILAFDKGGTRVNLRLVSPADSFRARAYEVAADAGSRVPRFVARTINEVRAANLKGIEAEASGAVREACAWHRASYCGANRLLGSTHPWTQGALRNLSDALVSVATLEEIRKVEGAARRMAGAERRRARAKSEEIRRRYREMSMDVARQMLEVLRSVGQEGEVSFPVTGGVSMTARLKIAPGRLQQGIEWVTDFPRELIGRGPIALAAVVGLLDDVPSLTTAVLLYDFLEDIVLPFGATPKSTMLALTAVGNALGRDLVCVKFDSGDWYGLLRTAPPFIVHLARERFAAVTGYRDGLVEWSESGVPQTTAELEFAPMLDTFVLAPASSLPPPELWVKVPDPLAAFIWG